MANTQVGSAFIKLGVSSKGFSAGLNKAKNQVSNFSQFLTKNVKGMGELNSMFGQSQEVVNDFANSVKGLGGAFGSIGSGIATVSPYLAGIGVAIMAISAIVKSAIQLISKFARQVTQFGKECVDSAKDAQKLQTILNSRLGSEVGGNLMKQLREFSSTYGIKIDPLVSATHTLLDFGYQADQIPSVLYKISGAAAQAGGDIYSAMSTITGLMGQIKMTGFVSFRQLTQLQRNGINIFDQLANMQGVQTDQIKGGFKNITPEQIMQAIDASMAQSQIALNNYANTYEARMEALKETMSQLKIQIGEVLLPFVQKAVVFLQACVQVIADYFKEHKDEIINFLDALWNKLSLVASYMGQFVDSILGLSSGGVDWVDKLNVALDKTIEILTEIHNSLIGIVNTTKMINGLNQAPQKLFRGDFKGAWKSISSSAQAGADLWTGKGVWDADEIKNQWKDAENKGGFDSKIGDKIGAKMQEIESKIKVPAQTVDNTMAYTTQGQGMIREQGQSEMVDLLREIADNTGSIGDIQSDNLIQGIPLEGY